MTTHGTLIVRASKLQVLHHHDTFQIKQGPASEKLILKPRRHWPDEFTWSGGFYMTPNEADARAFGAVYRERLCKRQGGLIIFRLFKYDMRAKPQSKVPVELWQVYDDFVQYDVIVGAV
ncbi:hypothetical protein B0H13DRAFT_1890268 [Mycena leptocephala]|nr:hypothetical protein B0H13DRAFT_1890268 [Mycena leptocephala]